MRLTVFELEQIDKRIDEITDLMDLCTDRDQDIVDSLQSELHEIILKVETSLAHTNTLPANVLMFDQSKRKKPLVNRVYAKDADVIDLAHFRQHREIKKITPKAKGKRKAA